jgi:cyclophilin family peptidyl-prolyl cis-trans isomerase
MKAFMTLQHGSQKLGTLHLELYEDSVPKTVQNFVTLLQRPEKAGYLHSSFHRIIPGFMAQGGDFTAGDGTGGESAAGGMMDDENFVHQHGKAGCLSMANSGTNTNGSQFFVTFRPTPHLNGKHVVFGHVDLESGAGAGAGAGTALLEALENIPTGKDNRPLMPVTVVDCGITVVNDGVTDQTATATVKLASTVAVDRDEDEIDLDDDDNAEDVPNNDSNNGELKPAPEETPVEIESEEEDESVPLTKAEALKRRLRKLKQKMNQARQLNRQAVQKEGERLGSIEGMSKDKKRQAAKDKRAQGTTMSARNAKAMATAEQAGVDGKYLVEQASESVARATARAEKDETNRFQVNDYYNSEGQHRNYQRNLKSLPRQPDAAAAYAYASTETYNPLQDAVDPEQERQGAQRLSDELHRRIEKSKKKNLKRKEVEETDFNHINQRNKRFNEKINRTYDKATAGIRQDLERGTAL